jgi:hypothetical protein
LASHAELEIQAADSDEVAVLVRAARQRRGRNPVPIEHLAGLCDKLAAFRAGERRLGEIAGAYLLSYAQLGYDTGAAFKLTAQTLGIAAGGHVMLLGEGWAVRSKDPAWRAAWDRSRAGILHDTGAPGPLTEELADIAATVGEDGAAGGPPSAVDVLAPVTAAELVASPVTPRPWVIGH